MSQPYRLGRLRGKFVVVWEDAGGKRRRHRLDTADPRQAQLLAPAIYHELTKPTGTTVADLWQSYCADKAGRAVIATMIYTWKALASRFGQIPGDAITVADCRAHIAERRAAGIKDWTLATELGHLRMVLCWAEKQGTITRASPIERPPTPRPAERHLTRAQARALIEAAPLPHVRLYIILALATAARNAALLGLTWDRCDFEAGQIDLRCPQIARPHKGRAIVPMNRTLRTALLEAKDGAMSDYVIEWAGKRVAAVKRGLSSAAKLAGLPHVSPHLLRHSAAVHMAEAGIPFSEIAQYLGHSNERVTFRVYGRFSPEYLKKAAAALEYDDLADFKRRAR